jgi:hypothetical protein
MAGPQIPVFPGPPTILQANVATGTLFYNADDNNAIWISDSSSVAPGNGQRIGALGSVTWQTAGSTVYGCVDTGVLVPVQINVNPDIINPQNPVDEGAAIAAVLIEEGITVAASADTLYSNTNQPLPFFSSVVDVSDYDSLEILIASTEATPGTIPDCLLVKIAFYSDDTAALVIKDYQFTMWASAAGSPVANSNNQSFTVPCFGKAAEIAVVVIQSNGGGTKVSSINAIGSSRQVAGPVISPIGFSAGLNGGGSLVGPIVATFTYLPTSYKPFQVFGGASVTSTNQVDFTSIAANGVPRSYGSYAFPTSNPGLVIPLLSSNGEACTLKYHGPASGSATYSVNMQEIPYAS